MEKQINRHLSRCIYPTLNLCIHEMQTQNIYTLLHSDDRPMQQSMNHIFYCKWEVVKVVQNCMQIPYTHTPCSCGYRAAIWLASIFNWITQQIKLSRNSPFQTRIYTSNSTIYTAIVCTFINLSDESCN